MVKEGDVYEPGTPGPFHEYGPSPFGRVIVAPLAPHVGKVILGVPAGNWLLFPITTIGLH